MISKDLAELQKEKNETCVSVIIPTHRLSPERRVDRLEVQRAVIKAKHILEDKYPAAVVADLEQKLDEMVESVDFLHNAKGVGIFVSPGMKKLLKFPFSVEEQAVVKQSFQLRDLIYVENYSRDYYLVEIDEKSARLFKGMLDELDEVKDENFPKKHEELYEYSRPARGSSYTGNAFVKEFEKDKSIMEEIRMKEFFNEIDGCFKKYISLNSPLLVAGAEKDISLFKSVTRYSKNIIDTISGNYTYANIHELAELAWMKVRAYLDNKKISSIKTYEEKVGEGLGVEGVKDVWEAAKAGRGSKLLVERDFSIIAYVNDADNTLSLRESGTKYTLIPDVVEDIIETVIDKNGDVIMMEKGLLSNHRHIALITRY